MTRPSIRAASYGNSLPWRSRSWWRRSSSSPSNASTVMTNLLEPIIKRIAGGRDEECEHLVCESHVSGEIDERVKLRNAGINKGESMRLWMYGVRETE